MATRLPTEESWRRRSRPLMPPSIVPSTRARSGRGRWTRCVEKAGRRPCLQPPLPIILHSALPILVSACFSVAAKAGRAALGYLSLDRGEEQCQNGLAVSLLYRRGPDRSTSIPPCFRPFHTISRRR